MRIILKSLMSGLCFVCFLSYGTVIPAQPHIYVEGYASLEVEPDQVKFSLSITSTHLEADKAKVEVEKKLAHLLQLTNQVAIKNEDITTSPFQINPSYDWVNGQQNYKGTEVSLTVFVMLNDLKKYPELLNALSSSGITSIVNSQASLSNQRKIYKNAQEAALKDAKQKAEDLAQLQNKSVKDVHSISEFKTRQSEQYNLVPKSVAMSEPNRGRAEFDSNSGLASSQLKMGLMKVEATIYVVYLLK